MKIADIYIRVSTDEQADKGYSQRNQHDVLIKYCEQNKITIRKTIFEDHSAKTFIRPEWTKLLTFLRQHKHKSDLILFTKWDRFSRNAPDAYQMIATLKGFGIEPQAIEQPLDMSVPENKMMLAIYLTAPEIENDRRALNVFFGMRRAKKEGRYMAMAPVGYVNKTLEGGKKVIVPDESQADLVRWAFKEVATGHTTVIDVWRQAKKNGLECKRSNFWNLLNNKVYIGKIIIPKLKDEESYTVDGLHEPLISESLFYAVQDVLTGRKRPVKSKMVADDQLVLKGFMLCPICNKALTGSASKGRSAYYHYYHCFPNCGYRLKAGPTNQAFINHLAEFVLNPAAVRLFKQVIIDEYTSNDTVIKQDRKQLINQISQLDNRIVKARELLLDGDIDAGDFKIIKSDVEGKINVIESKLNDLKTGLMSVTEASKLVDTALGSLCALDTIYSESEPYDQKRLIGSIYPEKFTFEEICFRTARVSEPFGFIYLINNKLRAKKNWTADDFSLQSKGVFQHGFEPRLAESESDVLPLHYWKVCGALNTGQQISENRLN